MRKVVYIDDLDKIGVIKDTPKAQLPINAWSDARNVVFRDGAVKRSLGEAARFGTPSIAPKSILALQGDSAYYWFYADDNSIYRTDSSVHTDVTRTSGAYSGDGRWSGVVLGNIPIMNPMNKGNVPQSFDSTTTKFQDLPNWPSGWTTKLIRTFGNFLLALDVTKSGTAYTNLLHWSEPADPLSVPTVWTPAATNSAGSKVFSETTDQLVDCLPLASNNIIYKESSVYAQRFIGGNDIFGFVKIFNEFGAYTQNCIQPFKHKHFVLDAADVLVHDGNKAVSVIDKKNRRALFAAMDLDSYQSTFIVPNYAQSEMWICIPEVGSNGLCTKAFIWNWTDNSWTIRELPGISAAASGLVGSLGSYVWDDLDVTWDSWDYIWDTRQFLFNARELLLAQTQSTNKFLQADVGNTFDGTSFRAYVERESLPLGGQDIEGNLIINEQNWIKIIEVWPQITGTDGETVQIYIGTQDSINDSVNWGTAFSFVIGTDNFIPLIKVGRLISIRIESTADHYWELQRFGFVMKPVGNI